MTKRYTLILVDPGCDCCSYLAVGQYDTLEELKADTPDLTGYSIDVDDDEAGDDE